MSAQIEPSANDATADYGSAEPLSLAALVAALERQTAPPSLEQLNAWLETAQLSDDELEPYVAFKPGNYSRHRVFRSDYVEMLILCWQPGHRTPIHDHNGAHGAVLVHKGVVWETMFSFDAEKGLRYHSVRAYESGSVTNADVPDIHQLGNPDASEQDLITIHIYAPPLGVLHTYKPGSAVIDMYTPDESDA